MSGHPKGEPLAPAATARADGALTEAEARARLAALSRRGFLIAGAATLGGIAGWQWLLHGAAEEDGLAWPLRRALRFNEAVTGRLLPPRRLAPTFARSAVGRLRANGDLGLDDDDDDDDDGAAGKAPFHIDLLGAKAGNVRFDVSAIRALPRQEMITEFKCIEGWSTVAQWAGARFADFAAAFPPPTRSGRPFDPGRPDDAPPYVAMSTPDDEYFVGLDTASALHPQTLLAWELNGAPLTSAHGAPLRLVIPVKYGIKNIKRIGRIAWSAERPEDYWAARGYDWYAGL